MQRHLWSSLSLIAVGFWLLFSYLPPTVLSLPQLQANNFASARLLQVLAIFCLLLFLVVQLLILWSTFRMRKATEASTGENSLQLGSVGELFWTALPLLLTLGLAALSYQSWQQLAGG